MSLLELARKINRKGDLFIAKHGIKDFHKKAFELLAESHLEDHFDFQAVVESSFNGKHSQHFRNLEFSDLPVTIAHGKHCFIDVYFWTRRPTVVHNHHFVGAFMCLQGNNVDLEFTFKKERKLGKFHDLGSLVLKRERNMRPGDIAEIGFMDKFIHQNHHQAELTINLCFRTPQNIKKSLSNYLYSGMRFEKNPELLGRVARMHRFVNLGMFDHKNVQVNNDDAINFLIQTYESNSKNPRLLKLRDALDKKLQNELSIDVGALMKKHNERLWEIENDYE